ncbi:hypothetical protein ACTWP5_23755 [Streptomyces sp. 4N509B]|uniref:hypothetical protein n=1 Tax=Streptomyces sp. 4N509B TaxID=3457413 RepID=UPI003FCF1BAF
MTAKAGQPAAGSQETTPRQGRTHDESDTLRRLRRLVREANAASETNRLSKSGR